MTDDESQYGKFTKEYSFMENRENLAHARNSVYHALVSCHA